MRFIPLLIFACFSSSLFAQTPESAKAYNKALIYYQSQDYENAAAEFEQALALDSSFLAARQCLATCYDEIGQPDLAEEQYRILIRQNPTDVRPYFNLALLLEAQGRSNEALDLCARILAIRPSYDKATKLQQNILAKSMRAEPAQRIGSVKPADPMILTYNRALEAYKSGSYKMVIKELDSQPESERDANSLYLRGIAYLKLRDSVQAAANFRKTIEMQENYADAHLNLGLILFNKGQFLTAAEHFERATRINPTEPYAGYFLGRSFYALGRFTDALPYLQEASMYIPDGGEARDLFRKCFEKANRPADQAEAAAKAGKDALGKDGLSQKTRDKINKGVGYYNDKDYEAAADIFTEVVQEAPNSAVAFYYYGVSLRESGKEQKAKAAFERCLQIEPSYAKAHTALGHQYYDIAEFLPASNEYEKAIEYGDESAETYFRLGNSFLKLKNEPKAITNYRKAIQMDALEADYHFNLGLALYRTKEFEEALSSFNRAHSLKGSNLDAIYYGSLCLTGQGKFEEALELAERAIRKNSDYAPGYIAAAYALDNLGKEKQAEKYRRNAYDLDPRLEPK